MILAIGCVTPAIRVYLFASRGSFWRMLLRDAQVKRRCGSACPDMPAIATLYTVWTVHSALRYRSGDFWKGRVQAQAGGGR